MNIDEKKAIEHLDRFLADNTELEELSAKLSKFNVFRALKIEQVEIRHSNVLAWLLDPDESHGLSETVLRRILSNILLLSEKSIDGVSPAQVELMNFSDIEVLREWRNIDVLVIDRTNHIVLFFENKIYSGESKGQLAKYLELVKEEFAGFIIIPVFLTLTGQESCDGQVNDYICYSHVQLHAVLQKLYLQRKSQLADSVQLFIGHYLETLRKLTMQDQELTNLCKTIYRKHREAIDMIVQFGKSSIFQQVLEELLKKDDDYEILYSSSTYIWFLPKSWAKLIPENGVVWTHMTRPVSVIIWIEDWEDAFYSHFEICKMDDPDLRLQLVKSLSDKGFKLTSKAFNRDATYSRFYGSSVKVSDKADYDKVSAALSKLLDKAKKEFDKVEDTFAQVFGNKN